MTHLEIVPAIMIGGAGSRLWPLSRANKPKQFLNLGGNFSINAAPEGGTTAILEIPLELPKP